MKLKFKGIFHKKTDCKDGFYVKLVRVKNQPTTYVKLIAVDNYGEKLSQGNLIVFDERGLYRNLSVTKLIDIPLEEETGNVVIRR